MKSKLTRTNMVAGVAPAAYADKCSTQTVAGDWSLTLTGTIVGGPAVGATATGTFDERGIITKSTEARNVGGDYADETLTGKWIVNPDCTGTLYVNVYDLSGNLVRISVVSMTFDDNSAELRGVQKSLILPPNVNVPVVITLEGRKQHSDH
jgi:hypothetical protein